MTIISGTLAVATMQSLPIYAVRLTPAAPVKIVPAMKKDTKTGQIRPFKSYTEVGIKSSKRNLAILAISIKACFLSVSREFSKRCLKASKILSFV